MIRSVKIKSGVLRKILKKQKFEFSENVNVFFGRNGAGKSLLLRTIANYCFVDQIGGGGWSKDAVFFNFRKWGFDLEKDNISEVHEFDKSSKLDIDWSGDPVFYMHHDDMIDTTHIVGYGMGGTPWINGIGDIWNDVLKSENFHPSSGQIIKGVTNKLFNIEVPDLSIDITWKKNQGYDSDFVSYIKVRKEIFKGKIRKPILILDEVDSQLDMINQIEFHNEIIPKLAKRFQIFLVSHSVFATKYDKVFDLDGSLDVIKAEIKKL